MSSALGDIGSHWCDLAQHVSGTRITHVLGDITTVDAEAQEAEGRARGVRRGGRERGGRPGRHQGRGSGVGAARFDNGAKGVLHGRPGLRRAQERPASRGVRLQGVARVGPGAPERALDRPPRQGRTRSCRRIPACSMPKCAATRTCRADIRKPGPTRSPTSCATSTRSSRRARRPTDPHPPAFATFEDGYRANCDRRAILESAHAGRRLDEGELLERWRSNRSTRSS